MHAIEPDRFYTVGEAAQLTDFSVDVLVVRCNSGVLPCRRPAGRGWRKIRGADLIEFLRQSGVTDPPPAPRRGPLKRGTPAKLRDALKEIECG